MENNKAKHKGKNTMRPAEETVKFTGIFLQKETSARLSLVALLAAFFGKLIKFKKRTRETTVALINPF